MSDLELLLDAADAITPIAERYFKSQLEIWDKGGGQGPVTEADLLIDKTLNEILLSARPGYGWLSEETDDDPARLGHDTIFIVDPIDGTRAFISGQVNFACALAVVHKGQVQDAVVHMPVKGITYAASRGFGATKNGKAIKTDGRTDFEGARVLASGRSLDADLWTHRPEIERHFRTSLAYRICLVAEGRFDAAMALHSVWEWDMSAGDLIAEEAGALCTDSFGLQAAYNSPQAAQKGLVVGNPSIHKDLLWHLRG
ncbi:MAG: 3'(2'),5'-bisphosphate nucleotidase CysQ [Pseudomonadota bacterium]